MKDLNPKQIKDVAGGFEPQQRESQLAPEPQPGPDIVIDYNPDRTPK